LGDPASLGKAHDGGDGIFTLKGFDMGAGILCVRQILVEDFLLAGIDIRLAYVGYP
jgi:hypothetical protein